MTAIVGACAACRGAKRSYTGGQSGERTPHSTPAQPPIHASSFLSSPFSAGFGQPHACVAEVGHARAACLRLRDLGPHSSPGSCVSGTFQPNAGRI